MTIDHTTHPHIIPAILAECDLPTTVAFRGTSRAFRDAVDAKLFAHVALYELPSDTSPGQGGDPFRDTAVLRFVRPWDYRDGATSPPPHFLPNAPAAVRVLDLDRAYWFDYGACTSLRIVRRANDAVGSATASFNSLISDGSLRCVVDFATLYGGSNETLVVPGGLMRYVLHLRWEASQQGHRAAIDLDVHNCPEPVPEEMVLVLHFPVGPLPENTIAFSLGQIMDYMFPVLTQGGSVRIVGVEEHGGQDLRQILKDVLVNTWRMAWWLDEGNDDERLTAFASLVEFMSVDEWHAELNEEGREDGLDAYELQAVWPGYATA
ncbi:hypothetical protein Q8F55_000070 [Vanrija albida]|uniref:F-box domain-containing protein n=1 Tax=Vanrija albida TaxID=181172 RepID=A0ABR3QC82_9TREE